MGKEKATFKGPEALLMGTIGMLLATCWMVFFLPNHPKLHEIIKSEEGEYLKFYSFVELDKADFNRAVKLIRDYIAKQQNPTEWQNMAKVVWEDVAEPNIIQDARYDVNPE